MPSLKKLAIRGTIWTIIGYGGSQGLRFASNLILTRLLAPELFGLMGIVNIFIIGLQLFSDVGIGLNIVQNKRGEEPTFYNTAWTIQIIRGFGLWIACCLIAYPIAQLYDEPQLLTLIPVVALSIVISGFVSPSIFWLERQMLVQKQIIIEISSQALGIAAMLLLAWVYPSVWALAVGGLISGACKLAWSYTLFPDVQYRFILDKTALDEIFSVGRWIFISTALTFVAEQADRLMLGKILPLALFGVYQIALTLSDMPRQVVIALSGKVVFPAIVKVLDEPQKVVTNKVLSSRRYLLVGLIPLVAIMVGVGDLIFLFLYPDETQPIFLEGAWMFPILSLGMWPRIIAHTSEPYLFAIARVSYTAFGNLIRLVFTVAGILIGSYYFGIPGVIIAVALNDLFYYLVVTYGLFREGLNCVFQDLVSTAALIGLIAFICIIRLSLGLGLPLDLMF